MGKTSIAWTEFTWNPVTGCSKVSEGCRNCYAERLSLQRGWSKLPWTLINIEDNLVLHPDRLRQPASLKAPHMIFVCSMSDLFHPWISQAFLRRIWGVIGVTPWHTYQILTKRPHCIPAALPADWGSGYSNVWLGVTAEDNKSAQKRIPWLVNAVSARVKFASLEPLLEPIDPMLLAGLDWVIVGGESGPNFRPMDMAWVRDVRDFCRTNDIPFFFKQGSGKRSGQRPYVVEVDGSHTYVQQYPMVQESEA